MVVSVDAVVMVIGNLDLGFKVSNHLLIEQPSSWGKPRMVIAVAMVTGMTSTSIAEGTEEVEEEQIKLIVGIAVKMVTKRIKVASFTLAAIDIIEGLMFRTIEDTVARSLALVITWASFIIRAWAVVAYVASK